MIFLFSGVRQDLIFLSLSRRTCIRGTAACSCVIGVAVGKCQPTALPCMRAADAHVVDIAVGDLPPCRHGQSFLAILNYGAIIDFVTVQGHVKVVSVALRGVGLRNVGVECMRHGGAAHARSDGCLWRWWRRFL